MQNYTTMTCDNDYDRSNGNECSHGHCQWS